LQLCQPEIPNPRRRNIKPTGEYGYPLLYRFPKEFAIDGVGTIPRGKVGTVGPVDEIEHDGVSRG
jgi:hypothetical protein